MITRRKRPADFAQRAKMIVDIATGEIEDREDPSEEKDAAAASLQTELYRPFNSDDGMIPPVPRAACHHSFIFQTDPLPNRRPFGKLDEVLL